MRLIVFLVIFVPGQVLSLVGFERLTRVALDMFRAAPRAEPDGRVRRIA